VPPPSGALREATPPMESSLTANPLWVLKLEIEAPASTPRVSARVVALTAPIITAPISSVVRISFFMRLIIYYRIVMFKGNFIEKVKKLSHRGF
jgi:hypothetical protein